MTSLYLILALCLLGSAASLTIRNAITDPNHLWPKGQVPYTFDAQIDAYRKVHVLAGMKQVMLSTYSEGNPCITFVPRTNEQDYITIRFVDTVSASNIGRTGGQQIVSIQRTITQDSIAMALMFVLGMFPEVSRTDRDTFLNVNTANVVPASMKNFLIRNSTDAFQQPFDYETIVMYTPYFDAINKSVPTISTIQQGYTIGQAVSLSNGDINLVQHVYGCPLDSSHRVDILGPLLFECHFHQDICQFTQDNQDDFDWMLQSGPGGTAGSSPSADHSSGSGNYMLVQSSGHNSQIARLLTPTLPPGVYCVVVWVHIYGNDVGELRVIQKDSSGDKTVMSVHAQPQQQWYHGSGNLASNSPITVSIEAFMGSGNQGDIAIDDVYIYNGRCIDWY